MVATAGERHGLVPVRAGKREIGTYAVGPDRTTFVPAVDVTAIVLAAMAAATASAAAVAVGVALRRRPAIGTVTMGPGGWISLKRSSRPPLRAAPSAGRPWWAHMLRARRLTVER
jgi:hypothetical protein